MKVQFICIMLTVCGLASAHARAELQIGRILKVDGQGLQINSKKVLGPGPLLWGDTITSDPNTQVSIVLYPEVSVQISKSAAVKLIGNLVEQKGQSTLSMTAIRLIRGQLQARVPTDRDQKYQLRVIGPRTITAVRGTRFEISDQPDSEVFVEEGHVDVEDLKSGATVALAEGSAFESTTGKDVKLDKPAFVLATPDICQAKWAEDKEMVLTTHQKLATEYKAALDKDVSRMKSQLQKDIKKVLEATKGHYDQFKSKKTKR